MFPELVLFGGVSLLKVTTQDGAIAVICPEPRSSEK
jgi:hypothetical protein